MNFSSSFLEVWKLDSKLTKGLIKAKVHEMAFLPVLSYSNFDKHFCSCLFSWNEIFSLIFKHYGLRSYFEVFEAKSPHQKTTYVAFLPKASCTMSSVGFVTQNSHFCSNFMASLFTKMLIL